MNTPLVSCLTATYGRPILLGEAIKCFLDQNYDNKELIILNDQTGVKLVLDKDYPNIQLINYPTRFNSLGEKRNYLKSLGKGEYFCIWDDDDLYPPHRISESVKLIQITKYDMVKAKSALMSVNNGQYRLTENLYHSQACISKQYMDKTNYPDISVGEDMEFEKGATIGSFKDKFWYVYRWGLGIHHLSGISDQKQSWNKSLTFDEYKKLKGRVVVEPKFQKDYWSEIKALKIIKDFS